ncbi:protein PLANT CADMIUM RESISTANCE 8-like [Silene latifolia]|uniref:protein PLANT CADMIUM RESISTANCE 8-like n=1 Tax=Silene latifolia TaxID=37657 RepID=UPI003D780C02
MSNEDGEIQPVIEPESEPPKSKVDAKTEREAKVKREKKSKSDAKAVIGNPWNTGLFKCHEDRTNAVVTAFLPCIAFGQIAEVLDEGQLASPWGSFFYLMLMPAICCQWMMGSKYRKKLRKKYDLVEAPYGDKVSHIFCACCSLCQEYRELKVRGLDPSLGWKGILAQKKGNLTADAQQQKTPPENQEMLK